MFNYTILVDTETSDGTYTYFDVQFSDGNETIIENHRVTNDAKDLELELLNQVQFPLRCDYLENNKNI